MKCFRPGCERELEHVKRIACRECWLQLPSELRRKLFRHLNGCYDGTSNDSNLVVQLNKALRVWQNDAPDAFQIVWPPDGGS